MGLWLKSQQLEDETWLLEHEKELCSLYHEQEYSILELQKMRGDRNISRAKIEKLLIKNGISLRGAKRTTRAISKMEETSLKIFGAKNASSLPHIKEKRKQTFIKKYGVENPFQSKEVKEKIIQTNVERYGHQNFGCLAQRGRTSKIHKRLSDTLNLLGVKHENEVFFGDANRGLFVDIVIDGILAVEIFGDYYHANPSKYKAEHKIKLFEGYVFAKDIWKRDAIRLEKIPLPVLIVWEYDLNSNLENVIKQILDYYARIKN